MVVSYIFWVRPNALSALPITKGERDMLSTPPAIIRSPSPALIAFAAAANGVQAGTAQAVNGAGRHFLWQPGQQAAHARHVAVVFAGLVGAAEHHVVDAAQSTPGLRSISAAMGIAARSSVRPGRGHRRSARRACGYHHKGIRQSFSCPVVLSSSFRRQNRRAGFLAHLFKSDAGRQFDDRKPSAVTSTTARSVKMRDTTPGPVNG